MSERVSPTSEWFADERYKEQLHKKIQQWGDNVAPMLEPLEADEKEEKVAFFQKLMESVENGEEHFAMIVSGFYDDALEACSHGDAFDEIKGIRINPLHHPGFKPMMQRQFTSLYGVYHAGLEAGIQQSSREL